jgi:8-oxo-dGTP pyrophosphatase MutT (NUDIX family)
MAIADELRGLLLTSEEAAAMDAPGDSDAAVLVPLFEDGGELHAVLTKRHEHLRRHPGEISFPGGRRDFPEEDLLTTALREAEEEVGLPAAEVELVGALPPTPTFVTGIRIRPFVGVIKPGRAWVPQPTEVETVIELPLDGLRAGHGRQRLVRRGRSFLSPTYTVGPHLVWGATARILENLFERLGPLLDANAAR